MITPLPISTAPRDGTPIILFFGKYDFTIGKFCKDKEFPWSFIDKQSRYEHFVNGIRDNEYGPSYWAPLSILEVRDFEDGYEL